MAASNSQRIVNNTAFLYIRMLIVMLINIFSVRYVLKGLGVIDYGVFNVVAGLVTMFTSLSGVISSATTRFHSYAIGERNEEKVSDVFTASLNIYAFLSLAILILGEIVGLWFINTQADIPANRMLAANWLFQLTIATFVVGLMTSPFSALVFAYERMQIFSFVSVAECILKFFLAYSLLWLGGDRLVIYGVGLLVVSVLSFGAYVLTSKGGGCSYRYKRTTEKGLYKKMLSFSGWTLFSSSAGIGISQLITMITNVYFGPVVNAARGISFQVSSALNSFTNNIIMAIRPPMIKHYAERNYEQVNRFFNFSNKAVYYSLLVILLPIFFEMESILRIWLDIEDAQTTMFCRLILVYVLLLSLNNPISIIIQATGNIRAYSTYVEIPTLLCFPITWVFYSLGFSAETAFYVMIVAIFASHIIRLICLKKLFPVFSYRGYILKFVFPALLITILISLALYYIVINVESGIGRFSLVFSVNLFVLVLLCLLFGLTKNEKKVLYSLVIRKRCS